jgi:hypothetical protein
MSVQGEQWIFSFPKKSVDAMNISLQQTKTITAKSKKVKKVKGCAC